MNIKTRIKRKLNSINDEDDISGVKFSNQTLESLLEHKTINVEQYADMVEFKGVNEQGSIKFFAYKNEGYKVELHFAFAKIFDFESDVDLTESQMGRLQSYVNNYITNNPFDDKEINEKDYGPYYENGVNEKNFYG